MPRIIIQHNNHIPNFNMSNASILYSDDATKSDYYSTGGRRLLSNDNRRKINPSTGLIPVIGNNTIIRIPKSGDAFLSNAVLEIVVAPVTKTGGTYVRLINAFGLFCMDRIELSIGGEKIDTLYPKMIEQFLVQHTYAEELEFKKPNLGYGDNTARGTAAASQQTFFIELNRYLSLLNNPLPISLLDAELEFTIYWANSVNVLVETDGTNPQFSFVSATINATYAEPLGARRDLIRELAAEANGAGFPIYSEEFLRITRPWAGGALTNQFQLTELNDKNVIYMNITDNSSVVPSGASYTGYNPLDDLKLAKYRLENNGKQIHGSEFDITDAYFKGCLMQEYSFVGIKELRSRNIYSISYSDDLKDEFEENKNEYSGSMSFRDMNSVTMKLDYESAAPANRVVTINVFMPRKHVIRKGKLVEVSLF